MTAPLLALRDVRKAYPGVVAVRGADLAVGSGEIVALVGENGAGKSTLIRICAGATRPDAGTITLAGRDVTGLSPRQVAAAGISVVHQELNLLPNLSVRANLLLGRERGALRLLPARHERAQAAAALARLGLSLDPETPVARLDVAQRQLVEVARALLGDARVLILDEPTATLTPTEVDRLFAVLRALRDEGLGLVFVSHRLNEILALADRIAVMRDGDCLGTWPRAELDRRRLIELMVGRSLEQEFPVHTARPGDVVLAARGLGGGPVQDADLTLRAGEIVGLAGLVGAGRTELARLLFGAARRTSGTVTLHGQAVRPASPRAAIAHGVALLPEDRKGAGLVLGLSALENFALGNLDRWSRWGWLDRRRESAAFAGHAARLNLKVTGPQQPAGQLSGGNQQKLLVARWLERDAQVVIFDEPTRGIDVGAKHEIYRLMHELADRGKAILMISSELPEILGMSDRIVVMREGRIAGEITDVPGATQEDVMALAVSA